MQTRAAVQTTQQIHASNLDAIFPAFDYAVYITRW